MTSLETIIREIESLNSHDKQSLFSYIENLLQKNKIEYQKPPQFKWAGCLKNIDTGESSVDIQHKIRDMWMNEISL